MPRLRYGVVLRALLLLALVCLWLQIVLSNGGGVASDRDGDVTSANEVSEQVIAAVPAELRKYLTMRHNATYPGGNATRSRNASELLREIHRQNAAQFIYNEDIYGPIQSDTVIIAVQVHTRLTYLRHLVVSLAQARGIERALLVFSHDHVSEEMDQLVQSIDFCRVMQIYYPYSIQTHPDEFPGVDPADCPRDAKPKEAKQMKCKNADWPDVHDHYREAKYTQTKHHWWWKANRIFNQLEVTANHTGMVVFLEEDHYVAEDFLYMLDAMLSKAENSCPQCEIFCLGTYLKKYSYHANGKQRQKTLTLGYLKKVGSGGEGRERSAAVQMWGFQLYPHLYSSDQKVQITPWHSSKHNMGMAFNRTVFASMLSDREQFCLYDDYNWDFSLLHLSQNRRGKARFTAMVSVAPRVFHIGECGIHHKKSDCNASTVINKVQILLRSAKKDLYPSGIVAVSSSGGAKANKRLVKGNGGWGDKRDQILCIEMANEGRQKRRVYATLDKT